MGEPCDRRRREGGEDRGVSNRKPPTQMQVIDIMRRHFGDLTRSTPSNVVIGLQYANINTSFYGIARGHGDLKKIERISISLRKALSAFDEASDTAKSSLDNNFRFMPFGDDKQTLGDWNLQIHVRTVMEMIVSACDDVRTERESLALLDIKPTKADIEAMSLIAACRRTWWEVTGEEAPRHYVKAGDIGGDPARKPSRFDLFARDVFALHGRGPHGIASAMDAWRAADDAGSL